MDTFRSLIKNISEENGVTARIAAELVLVYGSIYPYEIILLAQEMLELED